MSYLFSKLYDVFMSPLERGKFRDIRKKLIGQAKGRVLEIGSGTGVNFEFYNGVSDVTAIEPNSIMRKKSMMNAKELNIPIEVMNGNAMSLPFNDDTFDSAVATLVFCTIDEPLKALQELRRVCKHGARILSFEHVRTTGWRGVVQDILTPAWSKMCDGCHLNRETQQLINFAGFKIESATSYYTDIFLVLECVNLKQ